MADDKEIVTQRGTLGESLSRLLFTRSLIPTMALRQTILPGINLADVWSLPYSSFNNPQSGFGNVAAVAAAFGYMALPAIPNYYIEVLQVNIRTTLASQFDFRWGQRVANWTPNILAQAITRLVPTRNVSGPDAAIPAGPAGPAAIEAGTSATDIQPGSTFRVHNAAAASNTQSSFQPGQLVIPPIPAAGDATGPMLIIKGGTLNQVIDRVAFDVVLWPV